MSLRDLINQDTSLAPFTGSSAPPGLTEEEFLARQASDSQDMRMSELKESLGHPGRVEKVADTERGPFTGALVYRGPPLTTR